MRGSACLDRSRQCLLSFFEEVFRQHSHLGDLIVEDGRRGVRRGVHIAVVLIAAGDAHLKRILIQRCSSGSSLR